MWVLSGMEPSRDTKEGTGISPSRGNPIKAESRDNHEVRAITKTLKQLMGGVVGIRFDLHVRWTQSIAIDPPCVMGEQAQPDKHKTYLTKRRCSEVPLYWLLRLWLSAPTRPWTDHGNPRGTSQSCCQAQRPMGASR